MAPTQPPKPRVVSADDYRDPLYRECINRRPTPPDADRMQFGPTEQARRLELRRLAWALARVEPTDGSAVAAS